MNKLNLQLFNQSVAGSQSSMAENGDAAGFEQSQTDMGNFQNQEMLQQNNDPAQFSDFERLIKGQYKDAFNQRVQRIVDKRFAKTKNLEQQLGKSNAVMQALSEKYGVESSDYEGLAEAIAMEQSQISEDSEVNENFPEFEPDSEDFQVMEQALETAQHWQFQGEQLRESVPDFDIEQELSNPQFAAMLQSGIDVETAYRAIHMEEILGGAMQKTAQALAEKIARTRQQVSQRPAENGTSSHTGVITKTDVKELTPEDREEIARRVARGETISF